MNWHRQVAILIFGTAAFGALAQSVPGIRLGALMQPEPVMQATVCDIVNNPLQFEGKRVRVRAEAWADTYRDRQFWMNEVTMRSGKVCQFLKARINGPTWFAAANGFGTFTGRIVREPAPLNRAASSKRRFVFIVEQESDAYGIQDVNGLVPPLQLYDKRTNSFIKPEQRTVHVAIRCGSARPIPGTSAMKVDCAEIDLPANNDVWSRMIFQP